MTTFNDDHRYWQDRFDTRRVADRIDELLVSERIDENTKSFIESRDMFFLATCDTDGHPQCSYKGGDPGFVRVVDEQTIAFPVYDGNGMFLSLGNIRAHANVGMLFIDFEGLAVDSAADIDAIETAVAALLEPIVKTPEDKVAVVVNYDNFSIVPALVEPYSAMVERLTNRYYSAVTRYGTGGFLKAKLEG